MKLHLLLLVCLSVLRVQCTQNQTNPEGENQENENIQTEPVREPLYPHKVGIVNTRYNCYMSALFSCLYNIPDFQDTVYRLVEELPESMPAANASTLVSLVDIFVKMRDGHYPARLDKTMFPAIKSAMNWEVGEYQCVLEFWGSFVETMPERFKEIFQVKVATNYIRKSDDQLLKSIPDVYNYINIPLPKEHVKISSIVSSQFLDEEAEDYNVYPEDQAEYGDLFLEPLTEKLAIPVKSTVTFSNTPNVLAFGIKRLNYNPQTEDLELNDVPVHFDHVTINGDYYVPVAFIIFVNNHYYAIVRDANYGDLYLHNDTNVKLLKTSDPQEFKYLCEVLMKQSVMVFYTKISAMQQFKDEKFALVQANEDIPKRLIKEKATRKPAAVNSEERKLAKRKNGNSDYSYRTKRRKFTKAKSSNPDNTSAVESEHVHEKSNEIEESNDEGNEVELESNDEVDRDELESLTSDEHVESKDDEQEISATSATSSTAVISGISEIGEERAQGEVAQVDSPLEDSISISSELLNEVMESNVLYNEGDVHSQQKELLKAQKLAEEQQKLIEMEKRRLMTQEKRMKRMAILKEKRKMRGKKQAKGKSPQQETAQLKSSTTSSPMESTPLLLQGTVGFYTQSHQMPLPGPQQLPNPLNYTFSNENLALIEGECESFRSKLFNPNYYLGTEGYTFEISPSAPKSTALEYVLSAFVANSLFVKKIFSLAKESDTNQWEHMISAALVQMLIGAQNITLLMMSHCLRKFGNLQIYDKEPGNLSTKVNQILNYFSGTLNPSLMPYVSVKLITYSELDTDEPCAIVHQKPIGTPMFNSAQCIPPRDGKISGIVIDKNWNGNRSRSVLTTCGMLLPFIINRVSADRVLDISSISFGFQDYAILGGIFYSESGEYVAQFMSNYFQNQLMNFHGRTGGSFIQHSPEKIQQSINMFLANISKRSHVVFAVKKDCWKIESISARDIPPFLAKYSLKKIRERLFQFSMQNSTLKIPSGPLNYGQQATGNTNQISGSRTHTQTANPVRQSHPSPNLNRLSQQSTVNVNGNEISIPQAPKNSNSQNFKHFT